MSRKRKCKLGKPPESHPRCTNGSKLRYKSQQTAEKMLAQALIHGSPSQIPRRAYLCSSCNGWHLTSQELR